MNKNSNIQNAITGSFTAGNNQLNNSISGSFNGLSGGMIYAPYIPFVQTPEFLEYQITPENGWEPDTFYIVEVAFDKSDFVQGDIFYSGKLVNNEFFIKPTTDSFFVFNRQKTFSDAFYLNPTLILTDKSELNSSPNIGRLINKELLKNKTTYNNMFITGSYNTISIGGMQSKA
jgi:hypothetical protein